MQVVRIGDILARRKDPILIQDGKHYKRITIKINHNGISLRDEEIGKRIGTKRQFTVLSGQFLLSKIDALHGAFGIVPQELEGAIITGNFWTFAVNTKLLVTEWLLIFTSSEEFIDICRRSSSGTTNRKYLDEKKFLRQEIRLPDKKMQCEIVERYNNAKILYNKLNEELAHQEQLGEKLKLSIFMDAVQGTLVAQHPNEEPAKKLLERIALEKESLYPRKKGRSQFEVQEAQKVFDLPSGWEWCYFRQIVLQSEAGKSMQCTNRPVSDLEWGIIKTSAVTSGEFKEDENKFLSKKEPEDSSKKISAGDLIFCRASGSKGLAGKCCIVKTINKNLLLSDKTIRVITPNKIISEFINLINNSPIAKRYYLSLTTDKSTSMNNLTRDQLLGMVIPLPPIEEQRRILNKVQQLMTLYSRISLEKRRLSNLAKQASMMLLRELFQETAA